MSSFIVTRKDSETTHLAQAFGDVAFTLCGLEMMAVSVEAVQVSCRRCRQGGADARRGKLEQLAALRMEEAQIEEAVVFLTGVLSVARETC